MSRVELHGRRFVTARTARLTEAASWGFVVTRLMAEMNSAALNFGLPRRYADYDASIFGVGLGHNDFGWTAYEPLTNHPASPLNDVFFIANVMASVSVVTLAITAIAKGNRSDGSSATSRIGEHVGTQRYSSFLY